MQGGDKAENSGDNPPKRESLSFQDLLADLGELPTAVPKEKVQDPKPNPLRNRVGVLPPVAAKPGTPKAIYDRPRPDPTTIQEPVERPQQLAKGGKGQPAQIFFDDSRRQAILDDQEAEAKRLEELDRINTRVLSSSGYQQKPIWTTALLFAAVTAALLVPNMSSNDYREMFDPWLSFAVVFFAGITILISASGVLSEETILGRILCLVGAGIGAAACYLVYPNIFA